jgi:hypothetical protein
MGEASWGVYVLLERAEAVEEAVGSTARPGARACRTLRTPCDTQGSAPRHLVSPLGRRHRDSVPTEKRLRRRGGGCGHLSFGSRLEAGGWLQGWHECHTQ